VPDRGADHPQAEHAHGAGLGERRRRTISQCHADHEQADDVVGGVAEEVERVGLQRRRSGRDTGADLDQEHDGVDRQNGPEDATIGLVPAMRVRQMTLAAAIGAHQAVLEL
jgi:hypothetical protein